MQVEKSVRKAQSQVAVAIGQVQASFRAQMRADDAQLRAMSELDEAAGANHDVFTCDDIHLRVA